MFNLFKRRKKKRKDAEKEKLEKPGDDRTELEPVEEKPNGAPTEEELATIKRKSSEELCGIEPGMDPEEIRKILAKLFRRHNRAASSLNEELRVEAEIMLDAIVDVRSRYLK